MAGSDRELLIQVALDSNRRLDQLLNKMDIHDVLLALELEGATRRRKSVINRLIRRYVRLTEISTKQRLTKEYLRE